MSLKSQLIKDNTSFLKHKMFLEFGVCHGNSLLEFYNLYESNNIKTDFYGFDSFLGLPEEKKDEGSALVWKPGMFSTESNINPELLNKKNMFIKDGWFSDTLTPKLLEEFRYKKAGMIHVDCDIYSSAIEVLEFVVNNDLLTEGTFIIYDDWGAWREAGMEESQQYSLGEGRAHAEIVSKHNLNFELLGKEVLNPQCYEIAYFQYKGKNNLQ